MWGICEMEKDKKHINYGWVCEECGVNPCILCYELENSLTECTKPKKCPFNIRGCNWKLVIKENYDEG